MFGHQPKRAASAALLLLALSQGATAKCTAKSVTCLDNKHDGTIYQAPGGAKFKIHCGIEYAAESIGVEQTESFVKCIDLCEQTEGCVDVSYTDPGSCSLKGGVLGDSYPMSNVWTAERIIRESSSPSSSTSSPDGPESTDTTLPTSSASEPSDSTVPATSSDSSESTGISTSTSADTSLPTSSASEPSDGTVPATSSDSSESAGTSTSSSAAATSTLPSIPSGPKVNCADGVASQETFVTPAGREYEILCGIEFADGDLGNVQASDFEACLAACDAASDRGCVTVAYDGGLCYLKDRFRNRTNRDNIWGALYLGPAPTGATTASSSTSTSTTSTEQPEPTISEEPVTTSWPDSPPLPSSKVYVPEFDDSWMSSYSYMEISMPVYTATGTQDPVPLPTPSGCVIGPDELGAEFHLIDFSQGYLLKKGDEGHDRPAGPGFLTPPETEAEGRQMQLELADWKPPVYRLERPEGASSGQYDIVYVDGAKKLYVSVSASGEISFADASSESTTTVFTVDCDANIIITKDGGKYDFMATESGRTVARPQGPDGPSQNAIRFLLRSAVPENPNSKTAAMRKAKRAYDGMGQSGWAPRCPNTAPNVWPRLKPNPRPNNPNGCGSGSFKVPDLNFRHCCNDHDNCFDDCDKTFEKCNLEFLGCMTRACVNDYNRWYNFWLQPGCIATAAFYASVVQSPVGAIAMNSANSDRCECYCHGQPDSMLCNNRCTNVVSNPSNCGGCGRTCPEGTKCSGLGCVCAKNTCGNLCLDFLTHPRNCGRCGNVCSTGYCYQGVCSELPANPTSCLPREAFENGDFQRGDGSGWTTSVSGQARIYLGVFDGASSDSYGMVADVPSGAQAMFSQSVHMCPGQTYALTFKARQIGGNGSCAAFVVLGGTTVAAVNVAITGPNWQSFGPYTLQRIALGQSGVQQASRFYLTKPLTVMIMCNGNDRPNTVRMDSFSIAPM